MFFVILFGTYSSISSFSYTLWVGFSALDERATSPSLNRMILCRTQPACQSSLLPLKLLQLSLLPSLFLVAPNGWRCAKNQCPKREDCSEYLDAGWLETNMRQELGKNILRALPGRWQWAMGGYVPINTCFALVFVGPRSASLVGYQSRVIQGPDLWVAPTKVEVPDVYKILLENIDL